MIFYKASSFGNDFIVIDLKEAPAGPGQGELARAICDRQRGVGADGVVFYCAGRKAAVPLGDRQQGRTPRFEVFNQDGSAAELSGNGMAALAAVLLQRRLARSPLLLQADVGRRCVILLERRGHEFHFDVEIGLPDFHARGFFPFLRGPQGRRPLVGLGNTPGPYRAVGVEFHPLAVGNPHAVVLCRRLPGAARLEALGKKLEAHPMFPRRVNVEFVETTVPGSCRVFFYERGVGPTQASSTGSAAVFAVLRRLGLAREHLVIERNGESIHLSWQEGIHIRIVTRLICRGDYCA